MSLCERVYLVWQPSPDITCRWLVRKVDAPSILTFFREEKGWDARTEVLDAAVPSEA